MPRNPSMPGTPGKETVLELPNGRYRVRARMRLPDYTRRDELTGAWAPGRRVEVWATVDNPRTARRAIEAAARERIRRHRERVRDADPSTMTVREAVEKAFARIESGDMAGKQSLYLYRKNFTNHIEPALGDRVLADVTDGEFRELVRTITKKVGVATAKTARAVLGHLFAYCQDEGVRDGNPIHGMKIKAPRTAEPEVGLDHKRALTKDEVTNLVSFVVRDDVARQRDLTDVIIAQLAIGARVGAILAIRRRDVVLGNKPHAVIGGAIKREIGKGLVREATKAGPTVRHIPLGKRTARMFSRRFDRLAIESKPDALVFPTPFMTTMRDVSGLSKELRRLLDRAGFRWVSSHTFRRTAVTTVFDAFGVREAAAYAGHTSVRTTLDYYVGKGEIPEGIADVL